MIYVTVGTHTAPFDRLVRAAEGYAVSTTESVVIQRGVSTVRTTAASSFDFCDSAEMGALICEARVVVCQAADTILDVLRAGRPALAVPRRQAFGEHLNDHQVDFAHALADLGWITVLDEPREGLEAAIEVAAQMPPRPVEGVPHLAKAIRNAIIGWYPPSPR